MGSSEDLNKPISIASRVLAYTGAFSPDEISARTEQEVKPIYGDTPFLLIGVAVASQ
jgi:hypothetical protein